MATRKDEILNNELPENVDDNVQEEQENDNSLVEGVDDPNVFMEALEGSDEEDSDFGIEEGESETPKEEVPAEDAPQAQEPAAPEPQAQPVEEPVQQPQAQEPAQPPADVEPPQPAAQPLTEEQQVAAYNEWYTRTVEELAPRYTMNDEQAQAFEENPSEALSRMAARLHVDLLTSVSSLVGRQLPGLMETVMTQRTERQSAEEKFFETWPIFDREKDYETIARFGIQYRQTNPKADLNQFINDVGAMAAVALKKVPQQEASQAPANGQPEIVSREDVETAQPFKPSTATPPGGQPAPKSPSQETPFGDIFTEEELHQPVVTPRLKRA